MIKTATIISAFFLVACHQLNNRHDTLAVQCDLNGRTQDRVLLQFTNPGGIELSREQVAQLQVKYVGLSKQPSMTLSSRACVALPMGSAQVEARISGARPLIAEVTLDELAATDTIHKVELEAPGVLDMGLKCPASGLLAADSLENIVELKKSQGRLNGYEVDLSIYTDAGEQVQRLFSKGLQDEKLNLSSVFDIKNVAEGSYKVGLRVYDSYQEKTGSEAKSQCNLIVRRSCADEEEFDAATLSCVPKLCDNAYRVGAKWSESLALQRGEGRYECQLVENKPAKKLLSHTCKSGYFKSDSSCLAAKKLDGTCALLENDQVACWGVLAAKEMFPRPKEDFNFKETFGFTETIKDIQSSCVRTAANNVHCWQLTLGNPPSYSIRKDANRPQSWDRIVPPGYLVFRDGCGVKSNHELWCFPNSDGTGGSRINIPEELVDYGTFCAVGRSGSVWCSLGLAPTTKDQTLASLPQYGGFAQGQGLPDLAVSTRGSQFTQCALLQNTKVVCWGNNEAGSVGANDAALRITKPTYVVDSLGRPIEGITQIDVSLDGNGSTSTCALNRQGQIACWGSNQYGQLGSGTAGEDDEGNTNLSRFAVYLSLSLKPATIVSVPPQ